MLGNFFFKCFFTFVNLPREAGKGNFNRSSSHTLVVEEEETRSLKWVGEPKPIFFYPIVILQKSRVV
jgi:hypothetical protein